MNPAHPAPLPLQLPPTPQLPQAGPGTAGQTPQAVTVSVADALQLAMRHFSAGNRGEVEGLCMKILEVEPENAEALHLTGVLAHLAGKQALALALIEKAVRLMPSHAQFLYNLGVVWGTLRQLGRALNCYRAAVANDPNHEAARINLGNAALEEDHLDEALAAYGAALAANPDNFNVVLAKAIALYASRRFSEALPFYEKAVMLQPTSARAHWEHAHQLLMTRDYARGWQEYEYRFAAGKDSNVWCYPYPFPKWQGESLAGKTIILHGEQGLGDELMFGTIYPEIMAEAKAVIICGQPHVTPLLRDSFPSVTVIDQLRADQDAWTRLPVPWLGEWQQQHGAIDYQIANGGLPVLRRDALEKFPARVNYLKSNPAKAALWRDKLAHLSRFKVGLCWAANPALQDHVAGKRSRKKSLTLKGLAPLAAVQEVDGVDGVDGVDFVSLQTWEAARQADDAPMPIMDCSAGLKDFSDTAALVENLDLVITCDTSVAHMAGGMGKPVWILLPWQADWRWHADGTTTEWYPSARLYRQPGLGAWDAVLALVCQDLRALALKERG